MRVAVAVGWSVGVVVLAGCGADAPSGVTSGRPSATAATAAPTLIPGRPVTSELPEGAVQGSLGERVVAEDMEITIHSVRFDNCASDPTHEAMPGHTYALLDAQFVLLRSEPGAGFLGPLMWELRDSSGDDYASVSTCHDEGDTALLEPDHPVRRLIGFELPGHASGLSFVYYANTDSRQDVIIDLGQ